MKKTKNNLPQTAPENSARSLATTKDMKSRHLIRGIMSFELNPLDRPKVDADYDEMPLPSKTLESIRYSLALLEYTIAPNGWSRRWAILWLRLLILIAVPMLALFVLIPLLLPVFSGFASAALYAEQFAQSLFRILCWLIASLALFSFLVVLARAYMEGQQERNHRTRRR